MRARFLFFFNDTATTEIYTLSLHDALPICPVAPSRAGARAAQRVHPARRGDRADRAARSPGDGGRVPPGAGVARDAARWRAPRSEEHTSELQSRQYLVCRLLLEKKKNAPVS